jgi:hypothetical protein
LGRDAAGFALLDALAALALLALVAIGSAQLIELARLRLDEARQLQDATQLASRVLDDLALAGWHGLPARFSSDASRTSAALDSAHDELPAEWEDALLAADLPSSTLVVSLEGLGESGSSSAFADSVALRVLARVEWKARASRRHVELVGARF